MSSYPNLVPPAAPLPVGPAAAQALPAWIREDEHGGAVVTIGRISCPYANAAAARCHLEAMERDGRVRIEGGTAQ